MFVSVAFISSALVSSVLVSTVFNSSVFTSPAFIPVPASAVLNPAGLIFISFSLYC